MKNLQNKKIVEQNRKETVFTMEAVLFTNISEQIIKNQPMSDYANMLDFIAFENKLNAKFNQFYICGSAEGIQKTHDKLIESVKYN